MALLEYNKFICIIPARGISKRIPRKNLAKLDDGRSLLERKISLADSLSLKVFVTTDDIDIVKLSLDKGCRVIIRPPHLSEYETSLNDVMEHAYKEIEDSGVVYEYTINLFCDWQFVEIDFLREAKELAENINREIQSCKIDTDGMLSSTGEFQIIPKARKGKTFYFSFDEVDNSSVEIDTPEDLKQAKKWLRTLDKKDRPPTKFKNKFAGIPEILTVDGRFYCGWTKA